MTPVAAPPVPIGISQTATRADMATRAHQFVADWAGESRERAEKDTFWNAFFGVFGIDRRRVGGVFEYVAQRHSTGNHGFMDLFWPGHIAVEHKSANRDLDAAMDQLADYLLTVDEIDMPVLAVVSDFNNFLVRNLETRTQIAFPLSELPQHLDMFAFLAGYSRRTTPVDEEAANLEATRLLANLHDRLAAYGYPAHDLRVLLVRLLYILFADDTQVWPKNLFEDYVQVKTSPDGSDLGSKLRDLFDVLNEDDRMSNLDPTLAAFEYVNGGLFVEPIRTPTCDAQIRRDLLRACQFEWSRISPVIFGSLFQNVMTAGDRRKLGAHFTTERDILRTLGPLFLDELRDELVHAKAAASGRLQRLREFRAKLPTITVMDPACGCGNFLMVAFKHLRQLELDVQLAIREAEGPGHGEVFDINLLRQVRLSQFHGIELEEFPAKIAETAMHLADHQANMEMAAAFGRYVPSLPLSNSANIVCANALRIDWNTVVAASACDYVVGNPPFIGISLRSAEQTSDMELVWGDGYHGTLDYVTSWYQKAVDYIGQGTTRAAFVSTNSISQGEQVAPMWGPLLDAGFTIDFAHRTFAWVSEAQGAAHVHVVIIGFSRSRPRPRGHRLRLFDYPSVKGEPEELAVTRINPYLVEGPDVLVASRSKPLSPDLPEVRYGNKPTDGGHFIITPEQYETFMADPVAAKYVHRYVGARELIHDTDRWCLWLADATPADLRNPLLAERIAGIRAFREASKAASTREASRTSHLFRQISQPSSDYICIPRHVSGARNYFPAKKLPADVVASDATFIADDPTGLLFAVISSSWYIAWQNTVGGRIKSDLRFNKLLAWNTFPMPALTPSHSAAVIAAGQGVIEAREQLSGQSLADMYAASTMDTRLLAAHDKLDRALDKVLAPRRRIRTEVDRVSVLFDLYQGILKEGRLTV